MREKLDVRETFRSFFNKLFLRTPVCLTTGRSWQTFTLFSEENLEFAINDLKANGWTVRNIEYDNRVTHILCYRDREAA